MIAKETAVNIQNLSKSFKIPLEASSGLKQKLVNILKGRKGYREFTPLKNISFDIHKGDFFGIVGRNGSGKSTLLKTIAGIYVPNEGTVSVNGKLVPFIELGVGFNPELTGRENVFLNGALLGFSHIEIEAMYNSIVEFAELEEFMEERLKNYSSGMQVRLAFSIAIRADADILLLDEVLAVGDEAFQRKCNDYFATLKGSDKTVILVTHDMAAVRRFCNRAVYIKNGEITLNGDPDEIANQYSIDNYLQKEESSEEGIYAPGLNSLVPHFKIKPLTKQVLGSEDDLLISIEYEITEDLPVRLGISLMDADAGSGLSIFDDGIKENGKWKVASDKKGKHSFIYKIPLTRFNNRNFLVKGGLSEAKDENFSVIASTNRDNSCAFSIRGEEPDGGLLKQKGYWVDSKN